MAAVIRFGFGGGAPYLAIAAPGFDLDNNDPSGVLLDTRLGGCLHTLEYDEELMDDESGSDFVDGPVPVGTTFVMWQYRPDTNWDNVFTSANNLHGDLTLAAAGVFWQLVENVVGGAIESDICHADANSIMDVSQGQVELFVISRYSVQIPPDVERDVMPVHVEMWAFGVT